MKRHIAALAFVLAALGAASQVQAQGWSAERHHGGNDRHDQRFDRRAWNGDKRGGESWRRPWYDQERYQRRDQGRNEWRGPWRDEWRDEWRDGYRHRYWSEPRGRRDEGWYGWPYYRSYGYYHDSDYAYDDDGDISLLISLPLQY